MIAVLSLIACNPEGQQHPGTHPTEPPPGTTPTEPTDPTTPPEVQAVCDAGHEVWVQRVFPLMVGRKTLGATEVKLWADLAEREGREAVIRTLALSPEFADWWRIQMSDMVYASRGQIGNDAACFEDPSLNGHDGDLAQFIRRSAPDDGTYGPNFNMADVMIDAIVADDVSVVYQANLFAMHNSNLVMVFEPEIAEATLRQYQGDQLLEVYLDRNVNCMGCHNSTFSVTDDPDPTLDRAWGRGGLFEEALFDRAGGPQDPASFYAMERTYGVVQTGIFFPDPGVYDEFPWGMSATCGTFSKYTESTDLLGVTDAYFGAEYGKKGSVWDIERLFATGVDNMVEAGPAIGEDGAIAPDQAFAYLTAQNFVDQVWKLAFGNRMLLPYGMSRNESQQARLSAMTDAMVTNGWSLTELLVDVATDPYFNAGLPQTCPTEPYGMEPIIDPYTVFEEGELTKNGPGELVHRQTGRTLLTSVYAAMMWGKPDEYTLNTFNNPEYDLQTALGVFHSDSEPGFNGIDFQGALSWEASFSRCENPSGGSGPDFMRALFNAGIVADATVGDLVLGLKDRLTSHGVFLDTTEQQLVEDLLGVPLDSKVADAPPELSKNLGLLCGVMSQAPEFMMSVEPRAAGPEPVVNPGYDQVCAGFEMLTELAGYEGDCG